MNSTDFIVLSLNLPLQIVAATALVIGIIAFIDRPKDPPSYA